MRTLAPRLAAVAVLLAVWPGLADAAEIEVVPECYQPILSPDGSALIASPEIIRRELLIWSRTEGRRVLEGPWDSLFPYDLSADGSVIVGDILYDGENRSQLFRYTESAGLELLPPFHPANRARHLSVAISRDGRVVTAAQVGGRDLITISFLDPVIWIEDAPPIRPILPVGFTDAAITAPNADGSVAYGWLSTRGLNGPKTLARWTPARGLEALPPDAQPPSNADLRMTTPLGDLLLAYGNFPDDWHSYLWSDAGSMQRIENPEGTTFSAASMSADGSVMVGYRLEPLVFTREGGYRSFADLIARDLRIPLPLNVTGTPDISDDGRVLSFSARGEHVDFGCAVLTLDEPCCPEPAPAPVRDPVETVLDDFETGRLQTPPPGESSCGGYSPDPNHMLFSQRCAEYEEGQELFLTDSRGPYNDALHIATVPGGAARISYRDPRLDLSGFERVRVHAFPGYAVGTLEVTLVDTAGLEQTFGADVGAARIEEGVLEVPLVAPSVDLGAITRLELFVQPPEGAPATIAIEALGLVAHTEGGQPPEPPTVILSGDIDLKESFKASHHCGRYKGTNRVTFRIFEDHRFEMLMNETVLTGRATPVRRGKGWRLQADAAGDYETLVRSRLDGCDATGGHFDAPPAPLIDLRLHPRGTIKLKLKETRTLTVGNTRIKVRHGAYGTGFWR